MALGNNKYIWLQSNQQYKCLEMKHSYTIIILGMEWNYELEQVQINKANLPLKSCRKVSYHYFEIK